MLPFIAVKDKNEREQIFYSGSSAIKSIFQVFIQIIYSENFVNEKNIYIKKRTLLFVCICHCGSMFNCKTLDENVDMCKKKTILSER